MSPSGPDPTPESQPGAEPGKRRTGRNLPVAIVSGLALAGLFVGSVWWSPWALLVLVAVIVVIALAELDGAFVDAGLRPATWVAAAAGLVMLFGALALGPLGQVVGLVLLVLGAALAPLFEAGNGGTDHADGGRAPGRTPTPGPSRRSVSSIGATVLMGLWVPFLGSFIGLLAGREHGFWVVLAVIALTVSYDIGAYGFGVGFGRHRLAPRISPGKTWEGAAGGLAVVLLLAGFVTARLPGFDLPTALLLGAGIVPAATVGDLLESLVKRDLGVKDLGRVLPGHGGIMDRVDAILFALPVAHLLLLLTDV
ncbi:phosphatidate cytidylyltransferase [Egibacter rhizosphaerae]|uniref:Phosphatidate cytidylyltransferase n=1 Tax=Egibacter rhizosphaerae TaxID=1670831 RepID=A0A411YCQ5_9ACTN|nr:phosphatidate cytidylyltransferase [Egibacter rhizosphaerae]QBI18955.1 phosphatidate cytidylyltransferase [Egibacter rhizosphaerae]